MALCSDLASTALSHYILLSCSHADFPILIHGGLATCRVLGPGPDGPEHMSPSAPLSGVGPTTLQSSDGEIEVWRRLTGGHAWPMGRLGSPASSWPLCPWPWHTSLRQLGSVWGQFVPSGPQGQSQQLDPGRTWKRGRPVCQDISCLRLGCLPGRRGPQAWAWFAGNFEGMEGTLSKSHCLLSQSSPISWQREDMNTPEADAPPLPGFGGWNPQT